MITTAPPGPSRRSPLGRALLVLWGAVALVASAYLLGSHLVPLPAPTAIDARLSAAVAAYAGTGAPAHDAVMMHVLYTGCKCSQNVAEHLLARGPKAGDRELVIVVGDAAEGDVARLAAAGFDTRSIDPETLHETYGIEAAPLLVVADPSGHVRYVGGYGDRKQSPVLRDVEIAARIARGDAVDPLPLFGCAVSASLRSSVDPLGVLK